MNLNFSAAADQIWILLKAFSPNCWQRPNGSEISMFIPATPLLSLEWLWIFILKFSFYHNISMFILATQLFSLERLCSCGFLSIVIPFRLSFTIPSSNIFLLAGWPHIDLIPPDRFLDEFSYFINYLNSFFKCDYKEVEKLGSKWSTLKKNISPHIFPENTPNFSESCLKSPKI